MESDSRFKRRAGANELPAPGPGAADRLRPALLPSPCGAAACRSLLAVADDVAESPQGRVDRLPVGKYGGYVRERERSGKDVRYPLQNTTGPSLCLAIGNAQPQGIPIFPSLFFPERATTYSPSNGNGLVNVTKRCLQASMYAFASIPTPQT